MYQALYRKWRPRTFADVCGQDTVTTALKNELKTDHLSHAYLFTGCRGTGKTTCAKILAKAVNCAHPVDGDPCGECAVCRGIDDGSVLDVTEIDAASNNGVDSIRELREEVSFTPVSGKYRVYIIDEVHMLSAGAFNALLKTLEEPPAHVIFILATTEVHKLPATILSRCQRFDFHRIPPEAIAGRLRYVAQQEDLTLTEDGAMLLARLADGALRDALSLLDQCASGHQVIDAPTVAAVTGMAGQEALAKLTQLVINRDGAEALSQLDALYSAGKDMERLCAEWINYMRDLLVIHSVPQPEKLVLAAPGELESLQAMAKRLPLAAVLHIMEVLQSTLDRLRGGVARRVEMEMAVLRLCEPALDSGQEAMLRRIEALEAALRSGVTASPVPPAEAVPAVVTDTPAMKASAPAAQAVEEAPAPQTEEPPMPEPSEIAPQGEDASPQTAGGEEPFTRWGEVLEQLQRTCIPLFGVLVGSTAVLKDNMLLICTDNALFKELFLRDNNKDLLMDAIKAVNGAPMRIGLRRTVSAATANAPEDPLQRLMQAGRDAGVPIEEK